MRSLSSETEEQKNETKERRETSKAKSVKIIIFFWVVYGAHDGLFLILFCCMSKFSRRPSLIRLPSMNRNKKTPRADVKSSRPNAYKFIFYCCCICERIRHPFPYIVFCLAISSLHQCDHRHLRPRSRRMRPRADVKRQKQNA